MKSDSLHSKLIREIEVETSKCARCGACQSVCPIFRVTKKEQSVARGKVALAEAFLRGDIRVNLGLMKIVDDCLMCLACKENCPNNVDTELIIRNLRTLLNLSSGRRHSYRHLLEQVFRDTGLLRAGLRFDEIFSRLGLDRIVPQDSGLRIRFPFSIMFERRLLPSSKQLDQVAPSETPASKSRGRVLFFVGCTTRYLKPEIAISAIDLLSELGYKAIVPKDQGCCGYAATASGNENVAGLLEERLVRLVAKNPADLILTVCPTCNRRLRDVLENNGYKIEVCDISSIIVEYLKQYGVETFVRGDMIVTYHESCHLSRGLNIRGAPRFVLKEFFGSSFKEMEGAGECCGMGGLYGVTHPDISLAILDKKIQAIREMRADYVFTGCPACVLQLEYGLERAEQKTKVMHMAQLVGFHNKKS